MFGDMWVENRKEEGSRLEGERVTGLDGEKRAEGTRESPQGTNQGL